MGTVPGGLDHRFGHGVTIPGPLNIRLAYQFLELSGVDRFIALSYDSQQLLFRQMEAGIGEFGTQEQSRVAQTMSPGKITLCEDETFHPETYLVVIEPVSYFIRPTGILGALPSEERARIERVARECADLFQRSSSCVEGRSGQLALRHHSLHRLPRGKLKALTVVHNYFVTRSDGTAAAERFFGAKPADLFSWLLDGLDVPARPAAKGSITLQNAA